MTSPSMSGSAPLAPAGPPARRAFPCLDGYRAIAALTVVLYHVMGRMKVHTDQELLGLYTSRLGNWAVTVFFVLSGFLLYRPFALAHLKGEPPGAALSFYKRRLLRIIPAYWVALTSLLFVFQYREIHDWSDVVTFYGFGQIYRRGYVLGGLGQAWSLCVEMSFYLALPLLALGIRHLWWGTRPTTPARRMRSQLYGVAAMFALGWLFRWWAVSSQARFPMSSSWLPALLDLFALGMLLASLSCWVEVGGRLPPLLDRLARTPWLCWLFAAQLYWVLAMLHLPRAFEVETMGQSMVRPFVTGLSATLLLVPGTLGPERAGGIRRMLSSRALVALGVISYGIYLWHTQFIELYLKARDNGEIANGFWVMLGFVLVLTLVAATLSYFIVERPFLRLGRRRAPAGGPDASAVPAARHATMV